MRLSVCIALVLIVCLVLLSADAKKRKQQKKCDRRCSRKGCVRGCCVKACRPRKYYRPRDCKCVPRCGAKCAGGCSAYKKCIGCRQGYALFDIGKQTICKRWMPFVCDANCAPRYGCRRPNTCAGPCKSGYTLNSASQCLVVCDANCAPGSGCLRPYTCAGPCKSGYFVNSASQCQEIVCDVNCGIGVGCSTHNTCLGPCMLGLTLSASESCTGERIRGCSIPCTDVGVLFYSDPPRDMTCLEDNALSACPTSDFVTKQVSMDLEVGTTAAVPTASVFGWIIFQQRTTDGTTFNWKRGFSDYENGFGSISENFWLGLERLNLVTSSLAVYQLRIEVQSQADKLWYSSEYSLFSVGDSSTNYQLDVDGYSGDDENSLQAPANKLSDGMPFSAHDADNDLSTGNCANYHQGGFWFNSCYAGCTMCTGNNALWKTPGGNIVMQTSRMMMKLL